MAVEIAVLNTLSPRVVQIDGTVYTNVSIQDLYNAIREWEDSVTNEDDTFLIDAAGKEPLGGGVTVGITATLNNTRILFRGNLTPLDDGTGRTCDTTDSTGTQLYVDDADFVTDGVSVGDTVHNKTTNEWATITEVVDLNTLTHLELDGNGNLGWTSTDEYEVFENIQCNLSGGNLVAVDDVGSDLDPIIQSPFVQVVRTSSSSATLQSQSQLEHSTFNGGVTYDSSSSYSGTSYPVGTEQQPVNNLTDALAILAERSFNTIYVTGDATIDSGEDYTGVIFIGESMTKSTFTISAAANVTDAEFEQALVTGTLDGNAKLKNCRIQSINYINGIVEQCVLETGTITLGGSSTAHFLDCWSGVPGEGTPTINMGGSGQALAMRNYNGGIEIENKSGSEDISLDINSGQVILDSTVTNGTIVVRGISKLTDNSVGATVVDETLSTNNIWNELVSEARATDSFGERLTKTLKLKRIKP